NLGTRPERSSSRWWLYCFVKGRRKRFLLVNVSIYRLQPPRNPIRKRVKVDEEKEQGIWGGAQNSPLVLLQRRHRRLNVVVVALPLLLKILRLLVQVAQRKPHALQLPLPL